MGISMRDLLCAVRETDPSRKAIEDTERAIAANALQEKDASADDGMRTATPHDINPITQHCRVCDMHIKDIVAGKVECDPDPAAHSRVEHPDQNQSDAQAEIYRLRTMLKNVMRSDDLLRKELEKATKIRLASENERSRSFCLMRDERDRLADAMRAIVAMVDMQPQTAALDEVRRIAVQAFRMEINMKAEAEIETNAPPRPAMTFGGPLTDAERAAIEDSFERIRMKFGQHAAEVAVKSDVQMIETEPAKVTGIVDAQWATPQSTPLEDLRKVSERCSGVVQPAPLDEIAAQNILAAMQQADCNDPSPPPPTFICDRCKLPTQGEPVGVLAGQPLCGPCDEEVLCKTSD